MIAGIDGGSLTLVESEVHRDLLSGGPPGRDERSLSPQLCEVMERLKAGSLSEAATDIGSVSRESHPIPSEMDAFIQQLVSESESGAVPRIGHYELGEQIGRGGMGTVYQATDRKLNRQVAIKFLKPDLTRDPVFIERFEREAQAAAGIVHRNVVTVHGIEETNGVPWIVMEFVEGEPLSSRIRRLGPLTLTSVARIGVQIAEGLQAAHTERLVHRDIKPSNIVLLEGTDEVRITDYGLAYLEGTQRLTKSGVLMGTPEYMAPEQARGDVIDHRTDLFSLGSVLYAMCVGRAPFRGDNQAAIVSNVARCRMIPLTDVDPTLPRWLIKLINRLLEEKPDDRLQSAGEVAAVLRNKLGPGQFTDGSADTGWGGGTATVISPEFHREASETLVERNEPRAGAAAGATQRNPTATDHHSRGNQTAVLRWSGSARKWLLGIGTGLPVLCLLIFSLSGWWAGDEKTTLQNGVPAVGDQLPAAGDQLPAWGQKPDQTQKLDQGQGPFVLELDRGRQRFEDLLAAVDAAQDNDSVLIETDGDVFIPQIIFERPVTIRAGWNQNLDRPYEPVLRRTVESIVNDRRWMFLIQSDVRFEGLEIVYESKFSEVQKDSFYQAPQSEWAFSCQELSRLELVNCRLRMRPGAVTQVGIKADTGLSAVHVKNSEFFGGTAVALVTTESLTIENSLFIGSYAIVLIPQPDGAGKLEISQSTFICEALLTVIISRGWRLSPFPRNRFSIDARNNIFDISKSLVLVKQAPGPPNSGGAQGLFSQPDAMRRALVSTLIWTGESNVYDVTDNFITLLNVSRELSIDYPYSLQTLKDWGELWRGNARFSRSGVFHPARGVEGFHEKLVNIESADDLQPQLDGRRPPSDYGAGSTGPGKGYLLYCRDRLLNRTHEVE